MGRAAVATSVFPVPRSVVKAGAPVRSPRACRWIVVDPRFGDPLVSRVREFASARCALFACGLEATASAPARGRVFAAVRKAKTGLGTQGYRLACGDEGVEIAAEDAPGAWYGLLTLGQLLDAHGVRLPGLEIEDAPDFAERGVMIDISRCKVPSLDTLKRLIGRLAAMKINQVQLYTEHTFAFSAHEVVWRDASPLRHQEILELDAHCRAHFVQLVPNQNSFGHFERWLRHPEYRALAECPDGFDYPWGGRSPWGSTLKPESRSLELLAGLYDEMLPLYSSRLFNAGCDETWELGQGWSRTLCEKRGKVQVYLDFLLRIHRLVKRHGRQMMFWGDIVLHEPQLVKRLPKDLIALDWGYEVEHPFAEQTAHFARAGVPFYVCPGTSSWNSLTGRTRNCLANLANAAGAGAANGAAGYLNTDWGDGGHHQYLPVSWPGYAAGAALSWCFATNRSADVACALDRLVFEDGADVMGRLLLDLGSVLDLVPVKTFNSSIFNHLLFWDMGKKAAPIDKVKASELRACVRAFDELEQRADEARPAAGDGELSRAEVRNAIAMARHAARRGLAAATPRADRGPLRRELQRVIGLHEELWLARNRPGGLRESSGRLREALGPLA